MDWSIHRFRIWESLAGVGEWPLGALIPAIPSPSHSWRDTTWDVELVGHLKVLGRDALTERWVAATSVPVTSYLVQRLQDVSMEDRAVTDSTATPPAAGPLVWAVGISAVAGETVVSHEGRLWRCKVTHVTHAGWAPSAATHAVWADIGPA